ncbi:uncharacterized protein F5147DRAFT_165223 [Suillus discolor]|uniref:CHAT domain-containing protein n=1 Tax=Suillus discolor TaxID=1912936 RepID=A0A9P7F6N7_9AGAM|nr:uncharacterized protein F5147DRAFT_165223 [Suillus discolor]KAG2108645.1 hypothetical protein F5147DRAFT_165223 [Suillus discolor]
MDVTARVVGGGRCGTNDGMQHLACHSVFMQGRKRLFVIRDKLFTVSEIMGNNIFLSACHTGAAGYEEMPDEVIHLAAGLQFWGFNWSMFGTP